MKIVQSAARTLRREPVRAYLYSVIAAALAVAGVLGVLPVDEAGLWLGLAASVLAVEGARRRVTPTDRG